MIRAFAFLFMTLPAMASAFCTADGFESLMTPEDLAALHNLADQTPFGSGLYWSAEKDGTELILLGTMHLPDPRHAGLLARVAPDLDKADLLLVEATLEDQAALQAQIANNPQIMMIVDGPSLIERLDDATWNIIRDAAFARGLPGVMAAKMQPWALSMTLAMPPCAMTAMTAGEVGLDGILMQRAAALDIPVAALEPWQDMLALLMSGTFEEQLAALRLSIVPPAIQDAMISTLITSYFEGETAFSWHISRYVIDFMPNADPAEFEVQMQRLEDELLTARNQNWIPVIKEAVQTHDSVFVAFGAAHLMGETGVLRLLENDGWTIKRR